MPELDAGEYLVQALFDAGRGVRGFNGLEPLTWSEVDAYARATGELAEPWERKALHRLSEIYITESRSTDPFRIPPVER